MRGWWIGVWMLMGCPEPPSAQQAQVETPAPSPAPSETPESLEVAPLASRMRSPPVDGIRELGQALAAFLAKGGRALWPGLGVFECRVEKAPDTGLTDFRVMRFELGGAAQGRLNPHKLTRPVAPGDGGWCGQDALAAQLAAVILEALPTGGIDVPGLGRFEVRGRQAPEGRGLTRSVHFFAEDSLLPTLHVGHAKPELAEELSRAWHRRSRSG